MVRSFSPSSATRLHAVDAAAAGVRGGRVPLRAPAQRSLGCCRAAARQDSASATQEPRAAVSTARTQLDLLEQLTSPTSDGIAGLENGTLPESRQRATIREQLSALANGKVDEFTLPLGKRQAMLTQVSGRNDSVFFATVGAFVLVPPFAILAIAVATGYIQLLP
ncbi:hypothetical protein PVAP13_5KG421149 [Panicum virgatum]|uniref:Uncharacterized protein n=1 Tax=Panicum virgatum TaxID=38727 RepID=A0A8T0STT7_PANVG|nr:hypothetical protein PVAP13_5KG421149 [Panicum virgatum]